MCYIRFVMKTFKKLKTELLKDKSIKEAYDELEPEFALARMIIKERIKNNFSQADLAKKMGTKQSAIARLESGNYNPTVSFLQRAAKALNTKLNIYIG